MNPVPPRYADWKAPADDGQTLVWPDPATLITDAYANSDRLRRSEVRVGDLSLAELRAAARQFIRVDPDEPLVATGHQTELYHPGVWVKNALIDAAAIKLGGKAMHFAVDTDAPKHLHVRWPGGSRAITDDDELNTAEWSGLLAGPSPRYVEELETDLREQAAGWSFSPVISDFLASLRRHSLEQPALPSAIVNATHELDWSLGLRYHCLLTSPMWWGEAYLIYLHHLLADAGTFAVNYNAALDDYRVANGVKTTARPMPDLRREADVVEVPFWIDDLAVGTRERAFVHVAGTPRIILKNGEAFELVHRADAAAKLGVWCRQHQIRITPRALTLTLFFRLLLADQFVHGIGGGRYDQVTDSLIRRQFSIEPPRFAVTTATLYFPAAVGQRRVNLRPLLQEGRRIRHGMLSKEKMLTVAQIQDLPRGSRQRRDVFFGMHRRLSEESNSPFVREWEDRLRAAEHESFRQKTLFDRELFFAIQPRERLAETVERYRAAFG